MKSYSYQSGKLNNKMTSKRIENSNEPFIENVLDKYSGLPHLTNLALGSSFFTPPSSALTAIHDQIHLQETHKYGNILGYPALLRKLTHIMQREGLDMEGQDLCITAGANQAFTNVVLALADVDSRAILVAPYYFCHLTNLQLANVPSSICSFDKKSFEPNWEELEQLIQEHKPKLVSHDNLHAFPSL
jgi:katanin p60 ATPase-containing subunit A1